MTLSWWQPKWILDFIEHWNKHFLTFAFLWYLRSTSLSWEHMLLVCLLCMLISSPGSRTAHFILETIPAHTSYCCDIKGTTVWKTCVLIVCQFPTYLWDWICGSSFMCCLLLCILERKVCTHKLPSNSLQKLQSHSKRTAASFLCKQALLFILEPGSGTIMTQNIPMRKQLDESFILF